MDNTPNNVAEPTSPFDGAEVEINDPAVMEAYHLKVRMNGQEAADHWLQNDFGPKWLEENKHLLKQEDSRGDNNAAPEPETESPAPATPQEHNKPANEEEEGDELADYGVGTPKKDVPEMKSLDDLTKYTKDRFNIDKPEKLVEAAQKWRKQAQEGSEHKKKLEDLQEAVKTLPTTLLNAMEDFHNGQDWHKNLMRNGEIDYNRDFKDQNIQKLADHLMPEKYDFNDPDSENYIDLSNPNDKATKLLVSTLADKYNTNKQRINDERTRIMESQKQRAAALSESSDQSLDDLRDRYKNIPKAQFKRVTDAMKNGSAMTPLLIDDNGRYKPDAAEQLHYMMHGKDIVAQLAKRLKDTQAELKDLVARGGNEPRQLNRAAPEQQADTKEQNPYKDFFGKQTGSPFAMKSN